MRLPNRLGGVLGICVCINIYLNYQKSYGTWQALSASIQTPINYVIKPSYIAIAQNAAQAVIMRCDYFNRQNAPAQCRQGRYWV